MPWKKSKTIPSLITHYGRWTKQEENDFYNRVNFLDWKGSSGLVPHYFPPADKKELAQDNVNPSKEDKEVKDVDG